MTWSDYKLSHHHHDHQNNNLQHPVHHDPHHHEWPPPINLGGSGVGVNTNSAVLNLVNGDSISSESDGEWESFDKKYHFPGVPLTMTNNSWMQVNHHLGKKTSGVNPERGYCRPGEDQVQNIEGWDKDSHHQISSQHDNHLIWLETESMGFDQLVDYGTPTWVHLWLFSSFAVSAWFRKNKVKRF